MQVEDLEPNVFGKETARFWFICRMTIPIPWRNMKIIVSFYSFSISSRDQSDIIRARKIPVLDLISSLMLWKKKKKLSWEQSSSIIRYCKKRHPRSVMKNEKKSYLWTEISQDLVRIGIRITPQWTNWK